MNRFLTVFLFVLTMQAAIAATAQVDGSDCGARLVTVSEDVALEVLDWGGDGPAMVLLPGMGNTAHIFADFAHQFTDRYHVLGITRRGFGASSASENEYGTEVLAADILAILDRLELESVILVGHSIAGEAMTAVALAHPDRISALVYLDAAHDRSDLDILNAQLERPTPVAFTPADGSSLRRFNCYLARARGWRVPLCELRALYRTDDTGAVVGINGDPAAAEKIQAGLVPAAYEKLEAPALAIFVRPTLQGMFPAYRGFDEADLQKANHCVAIYAERAARDIERFQTGVRGGEVVVLDGANHHLFLTHEGDVVREMRRFLAGLDAGNE